jgi:hypothetical protein
LIPLYPSFAVFVHGLALPLSGAARFLLVLAQRMFSGRTQACIDG